MTGSEAIWTKHESRRLPIENKWKKVIELAGRRSLAEAAQTVNDNEGVWIEGLRRTVHGGELGFVLIALNIQTALLFAYKNNKQILKLKSAGDEIPGKWLQSTINYFREHNLKLLTDISEKTRENAISSLMRSQELGLGAKERAKLLVDEGFSKKRALVIARTETVRAANYGNLLSAIESDLLLKKKWIARLDDRTRHSHAELDGKIIDLYDDFKTGLMFPGDPSAPAKETVNCRCTLGMVPQRDENGDLMRKPPVLNIPVQTVDYAELIQELIAFINLTPGKKLSEIVSSEIFDAAKTIFVLVGLENIFNTLFN